MAKTYADIQAQIEKLQAQAQALRDKEMADVIGRIREAMDHYGLTLADLGLAAPRARRAAGAAPRRARSAAAPKYGDGQGNVWGGRGPRPAWLREALAQGHALEEFATSGRADAGAPAPSRPARGRKAAAAPKRGRGRGTGKAGARGAKAGGAKAGGARARKGRAVASAPPQAEAADDAAPGNDG
jgi:DNA-binding protein H-NS